ncbi:putative two-component hybrid sensor and regulator [Sphingomonas changbaiensis NBRC 104936]|uniref:histidine kinase n=1 Tax=Sphingomonas changbaiensis NBRC 104936 TaxID=1219043 RepID=A0A0E9MLW7_9SPHN|nr:putative two-component hybrid sensor and regulator [Sphingomonas changbaiensis NBRC 104936]
MLDGVSDDARLVQLLDSIDDGYVAVDGEWRIRLFNRAAAEFVGRHRAELIGRTLWEGVPEIVGTETERQLRRAAAGEKICFETRSSTRPDRDVVIRAVLLPDRSLTITFSDITERTTAERTARESEARFRLIADSAPVPMWVTSLDRKRWFVNRAYVEFLGVGYEEATQFDWRSVIHPDDIGRILKEQVEKEASLQPFMLEARYRKTGGDYCWLRSHSQPRWGPDGEHVGFIGVAFDVTIAKDAELELQRQVAERTAELEALYTRTPTILQSQSADGRLVSVSDRWLEFMGFESREQVVGRPAVDFLSDGDLERYRREDWPALLAGREVKDAEYRVVKRNGEIADVLISSRPWHDSEGRFVRTMAAIIDVSARKRTEEALRQAQKVEAMGQLTGGVAHDFNNLLAPIIGGLDLLQRRGVGDARTQQTIGSALQAAERAKTLVQRLLAFARRQPLQPSPVDAGRLIEGMAELIGSTVGPRIRLVLDVSDDLPACLADPNQVEMALLNLSVNARDAMPDGGTLTIAAGVEQVDEAAHDLRPGSYVRLAVSDTGCGMDEDVAARAIEPFFSTKGIGRGTGLGLSMVHGLAAQLGGALRLKSAPGQGTEVQLWLPCAAARPEASAAGQSPRTVNGAGAVLLVDDEPLVRASTADMLEDMGFTVVALESADEAAARLADGLAVDLIVTDHLMPGMTGTELARTVRSTRPGTPVLIISGYAEAGGIESDLPRLTKPFRHADLAAMLTTLLG